MLNWIPGTGIWFQSGGGCNPCVTPEPVPMEVILNDPLWIALLVMCVVVPIVGGIIVCAMDRYR